MAERDNMPRIMHGISGGDAGTSEFQKAVPQRIEAGGFARFALKPLHRRRIASGTLANSQTTMWTSRGLYTNGMMLVVNNDTSTRTFQLHHVPVGGSATTSNLIFPLGCSLDAGKGISLAGIGIDKDEFFSGLCDSNTKVSWTFYASVE